MPLNDTLMAKEAGVLAQFRTGIYDLSDTSKQVKRPDPFFDGWDAPNTNASIDGHKRGNRCFYLGGKAPAEPKNMDKLQQPTDHNSNPLFSSLNPNNNHQHATSCSQQASRQSLAMNLEDWTSR